MNRHQDIFAGTGAIRHGQGFDVGALDRWLAANVAGYRGPLTVKQFKGGQSNPTYKLETPGHDYVLRRKPPGLLLKGAHAVEREYRVTMALHARGFPVAKPHALCMDDAVIGTRFYVMDMVEGRIFWDSTFRQLSAVERADCFDAINATIAQLHSLDPAGIGLADYGRPGNYFERQIARWARQYRDDTDAGEVPALERLIDWLPANIPSGTDTAVVHGDLRGDNFIFALDQPRVIAVLDWELSTLGHPLADFTYNLMMYRLPPAILGGFNGADIDALGIPTEQAYISAYCRRTGRAGIDRLDFYLAFNMFRFAAIIHGIKGRIVRGTASSDHARSLAAILPQLAEIAWAQTGER